MNLKDYLLLMLEQKYRLTPEDGTVLVAIISAVRHREIPVALKACPRLDAFEECGIQGVYEAVKMNTAWFKFVLDLQHAKTQADVYNLLNALMEHAYTGVSKLALVLTSEWQYAPRMLEAWSDEPEPETPAPVTSDYNGWLATGKYTIEVKAATEDHGADYATYDLTVNDHGDVPVEVLLARVIHAAFDPATMQVVPTRLENVTKLLAQLFMHERNHHELQLKQVAEQQQQTAPTSAARLWPTDDNHWIYDPELSKLQVCWPMLMGNPLRDAMRDAIDRTAKFAVSRASAMGSSRIFNLEAFVYNMIIGLIGDGASTEGDFDWKGYLGLAEKPEEPYVKQLRSILPEGYSVIPVPMLEHIGRMAVDGREIPGGPMALPVTEPVKPAARPRAPTKAAAKAK